MVTETWTIGRGHLTVRELAPTVLLMKVGGILDNVMIVEAFEAWYSRIAERGNKIDLFWEMEDKTIYKSECQKKLENWQKQMEPTIRSSTVYTRSSLIVMAITVTNMVLGSLHRVTADRNVFDALINKAVSAATNPTPITKSSSATTAPRWPKIIGTAVLACALSLLVAYWVDSIVVAGDAQLQTIYQACKLAPDCSTGVLPFTWTGKFVFFSGFAVLFWLAKKLLRWATVV